MGSLNLKIIFRFLGLTAVLNGVFMFIAIPFSMYHQEEAQMGILNAGKLQWCSSKTFRN